MKTVINILGVKKDGKKNANEWGEKTFMETNYQKRRWEQREVKKTMIWMCKWICMEWEISFNLKKWADVASKTKLRVVWA